MKPSAPINRKWPKRFILSLLIPILCFFAATFFAYLLGANADTLSKAGDTLDHWRYLLMTARLTIIFLVWFCWDDINKRLYPDTIKLYPKKRQLFAAMRHHVLFGFLAIEILLAQNLLGYLLGAIV